MADLPKQPKRGDDILTAFNALRDFVRKERLLSVVGGRLSQTDAGKTLTVAHAPTPARVVSFGCSNAGLVITIKVGKVYFKGVSKTILGTPVGWPNVTITATTYGYISLNLTNGEFTWGTSATDPGDGDDDTEIFRVFVATVTGSGATAKITELHECQHGDIRSMGNA